MDLILFMCCICAVYEFINHVHTTLCIIIHHIYIQLYTVCAFIAFVHLLPKKLYKYCVFVSILYNVILFSPNTVINNTWAVLSLKIWSTYAVGSQISRIHPSLVESAGMRRRDQSVEPWQNWRVQETGKKGYPY